MARISGVTYEHNTRGVPTGMYVNLRKYGSDPYIEDFIDSRAIADAEDEETVPWNDVKKRLDKKYGICTKS